ncbi:hypothetical protein HWI79_2046 [Cryptosporidium felis]|nr:hypothetical protein HWI79_2046 [Cryptosporidium felis]
MNLGSKSILLIFTLFIVLGHFLDVQDSLFTNDSFSEFSLLTLRVEVREGQNSEGCFRRVLRRLRGLFSCCGSSCLRRRRGGRQRGAEGGLSMDPRDRPLPSPPSETGEGPRPASGEPPVPPPRGESLGRGGPGPVSGRPPVPPPRGESLGRGGPGPVSGRPPVPPRGTSGSGGAGGGQKLGRKPIPTPRNGHTTGGPRDEDEVQYADLNFDGYGVQETFIAGLGGAPTIYARIKRD